jgi:hypothetical protein
MLAQICVVRTSRTCRPGRRLLSGPGSLAGATGLATWIGTTWVHAGLGLGPALAGALTVVPVALLCLAALAALAWAPSMVLALGILPVATSCSSSPDTFGRSDAIRWFCPFVHLNAVPAEPWDVSLARSGCCGSPGPRARWPAGGQPRLMTVVTGSPN